MVRDNARRTMLLSAAVEGGATQLQMRKWRTEGNAIDLLDHKGPIIEQTLDRSPVFAPLQRIECAYCGEGPEAGAVETIYVHRACERHFHREVDRLKSMLEARGEDQ
jgi:hypothetical protein